MLANMKPAKLFGVESRGMILAADGEGAVLLMPEKEVKEGTRVRRFCQGSQKKVPICSCQIVNSLRTSIWLAYKKVMSWLRTHQGVCDY